MRAHWIGWLALVSACGGGAGGTVTVDAPGAVFLAHEREDGTFEAIEPTADGRYTFTTDARYGFVRVCPLDESGSARVFAGRAAIEEQTEWWLPCAWPQQNNQIHLSSADGASLTLLFGTAWMTGGSEFQFPAVSGTRPLAAVDDPPTRLLRRQVEVDGDTDVVVDMREGVVLTSVPVTANGSQAASRSFLVIDGHPYNGLLDNQEGHTPHLLLGEAGDAMLAPFSALEAGDLQVVEVGSDSSWALAILDHDVEQIDLELRAAPVATAMRLDDQGMAATFSSWPVGHVQLHAFVDPPPGGGVQNDMVILPGWFEDPGAERTEIGFPNPTGTPGWDSNWSWYVNVSWSLYVNTAVDDLQSIGFHSGGQA
jgi:hypothetical protein